MENILKIIIIPHIIKDPETNSQIFFVYKSRFCEITQWAKFCEVSMRAELDSPEHAHKVGCHSECLQAIGPDENLDKVVSKLSWYSQ